MPNVQIEKSTAARKTVPSKKPRSAKKSTENIVAPTRAASSKPARVAEPAPPVRTTKQEQILTLLNRTNGASVEELMTATGWQVHSVRGFLAGTVKKKLGFNLTSIRADGDVRRYRIQSRGGR